MMKKQIKIGLLVICSATLLTACNSDKDGLRDNVSATSKIYQKSGTALAKEKAYSTGSAFVKISGSIPQSDISFIDSWSCEDYPVEVYDLKTKSESGEPDGNFLIAVIEISDDDWRFLDMSPRFNAVHQFTNEELSDYREECRDIFLSKINQDSAVSSSNTTSKDYEEDIENSKQPSKSNNSACYLLDGQRFECFETVSGEDITLTVHLYYSDDSSTPSSYKGELSNGVEFWFEPYESSSDCVTYKIDCMDGTTAYLQYAPDTSEIVFTADEGTEYGNMYAYSGIYIGLPDEVEE